jgi:hypothetical protein
VAAVVPILGSAQQRFEPEPCSRSECRASRGTAARLPALAAALTLQWVALWAEAQPAPEPPAEGGVAPGEQPADRARPSSLPWRGTRLLWAHSATTQTAGLGQDPQTRNPTYEMSYLLRPRYSLYADDVQGVSISGEAGVTRELTNSDVTTRRGEWSLTDAMLYGAYGRLLHQAGGSGDAPVLPDEPASSSTREYTTGVGLRVPVLTFPTSTVSRNNGTWLGLGTRVALQQSLPVAGLRSAFLPAADLQLGVGYTHLFSEATEPTSSQIERIRMDPDGVSVVSDQLDGAAFARHQATLLVAATLFFTHRVSWATAMGWRPSYRYRFYREQQLCGVVTTGCTTVASVQDPEAFSVVTAFSSELGIRALDQLGIAAGYSNVTLQLRPDGQRRNVLYSPDARLQLAVTFHLDELYASAAGRRRPAGPRQTTASRALR